MPQLGIIVMLVIGAVVGAAWLPLDALIRAAGRLLRRARTGSPHPLGASALRDL
ncbi:MAG TPA: hypothetical protein VMT68_13945 [Caulobacteraceae bacterium]|nr:hypothetical protein [Caulobacteraceae bacterium]